MTPKTLNLTVAGVFLLLVALAFIGFYRSGRQAERAANAEATLGSLTEAYTSLVGAYARTLEADSAAERARLAFREPAERSITRYVTLRDTIAYTDTVLVEVADEAVTTCSFALLSCEARIATSDSVRANLEAQVRNLEAQVRAARSVTAAACSGQVPAWTVPVSLLVGAGAGAWIRGN